jgi:hypothetical protein
MNEIMECTLQVMKEKRLRNESLRNRKWDKWNALVEKTTRTLCKATHRPRRVSWRGSSFSPKEDPVRTYRSSMMHTNPPPTSISKLPSPQPVDLGRRPRSLSLGPTCSSGKSVTNMYDHSNIFPHPHLFVPFSPIVSPEKKRAKRLSPTRNLPPLPGKATRDVVYFHRLEMGR